MPWIYFIQEKNNTFLDLLNVMREIKKKLQNGKRTDTEIQTYTLKRNFPVRSLKIQKTSSEIRFSHGRGLNCKRTRKGVAKTKETD